MIEGVDPAGTTIPSPAGCLQPSRQARPQRNDPKRARAAFLTRSSVK